MQKFMKLTALVLALLMLSACNVNRTLREIAEELEEHPEAILASDTEEEPAADGAPAAEADPDTADDRDDEAPASATDAQTEMPDAPEIETVETDFSTLSAADCIADREDVTNGRLPIITLSCPGADAINDDIDGRFGYLVGEDYCRLNYECYKGAEGRFLSLLVSESYDDDWISYTPYVLDVVRGEWIGGEELLSHLNIASADVEEEELTVLSEEFEHMYGDGSMFGEDGAAFFEEQRDRTTSADNADTSRVWLGDQGRLMFIGRLYGMAGAEYYEYPFATGYSFP